MRDRPADRPTDYDEPAEDPVSKAVRERVEDAIRERKRALTDTEIKEILLVTTDEITSAVVGIIDDQQHAAVAAQRISERGFTNRNRRRWRRGFAAMETLWLTSADMGGAFNDRHRPEAVASEDYRFEALASLQARSLLVAREAICLMEHGYAEAALARWRTLHELATIATLISTADQEIALRYLASFRVKAFRAASQANHHFGPDHGDSFAPEQLGAMEVEAKRIALQFGANLKEEFEWARPALNGLPPKKRLTLFDLEEAVGLQKMRPYFTWASQHNHGGFRPHHALLGMAEAKETVLLIGASDAGMVDPLQLVSRSLMLSTVALLKTDASAEIIVKMRVLEELQLRVTRAAFDDERLKHRRMARRQKRAGDQG